MNDVFFVDLCRRRCWIAPWAFFSLAKETMRIDEQTENLSRVCSLFAIRPKPKANSTELRSSVYHINALWSNREWSTARRTHRRWCLRKLCVNAFAFHTSQITQWPHGIVVEAVTRVSKENEFRRFYRNIDVASSYIRRRNAYWFIDFSTLVLSLSLTHGNNIKWNMKKMKKTIINWVLKSTPVRRAKFIILSN